MMLMPTMVITSFWPWLRKSGISSTTSRACVPANCASKRPGVRSARAFCTASKPPMASKISTLIVSLPRSARDVATK